MDDTTTIAVPGHCLPNQLWWDSVHFMINTSFQTKDVQLFPEGWTRLPDAPEKGAQSLKNELGSDGVLVVVFQANQPIACAGATPFRGFKRVERNNDAKHPEAASLTPPPAAPNLTGMEDWEVLTFCIHPKHRGKGLSSPLLQALSEAVVPLGAKRLLSNYVIEESGRYWSHLGFEDIPGWSGIVRKGLVAAPGLPVLEWDIHSRLSARAIEQQIL